LESCHVTHADLKELALPETSARSRLHVFEETNTSDLHQLLPDFRQTKAQFIRFPDDIPNFNRIKPKAFKGVVADKFVFDLRTGREKQSS